MLRACIIPCINILLAVNSIHKHFCRCFCATGYNVCWVYEENLADSANNDVLSLMVNEIRFSPYSAHSYLNQNCKIQQNIANKNCSILMHLTIFSLVGMDEICCHSSVFLIRPTPTHNNSLKVDLKILIFWFMHPKCGLNEFVGVFRNPFAMGYTGVKQF